MAIAITGSTTTGLSQVTLTNVYAGGDYTSDEIQILSTNVFNAATNITIPYTLAGGVTLGDVTTDLTIRVMSGTNQRDLVIGTDFTASNNAATTPDQIEIIINANEFAAADETAVDGPITLLVGIPSTQTW